MENEAVNLSESAKSRILELQSKSDNHNKHLRITVSGGGCNGLRYQFDLDEKVNDDDFKISGENGVILTIDKISLGFINGGTVDFIRDLGSSYFKINNPNAKSGCGCGDSFSV
ncbi:MAG: putative iron binding protein from the HesB IscA SufA family [Rickettsiaceae bacterium]|jgi:iron-sulfur cluster insertion protein|nr:putative iron binding protein from the HesB IscA SufA family [Rickettsiaceae bacterium]